MPTNRVGTILLAHGSASSQQRAVVDELAARAATLDGSRWRTAFLDHHGPTVSDAALDLVGQGVLRIVVVPALLSSAFHARHDVPTAIASAGITVPVVVADPIGPDPRLFDAIDAQLLADSPRVDVSGGEVGWTIVVASAGTSDESARSDFVAAVKGWIPPLARCRAVPAFVAGGDPDVGAATREATTTGRSVIVAPFLLADGALGRRAVEQAITNGAVAVLPALGAANAVVSIVRARRDACATV